MPGIIPSRSWITNSQEASPWDHLLKLLQGALGSRMSCQVEMQHSTRSDLHHDEHIENARARRYRNKEIAQLGAAVILQAIEDRATRWFSSSSSPGL